MPPSPFRRALLFAVLLPPLYFSAVVLLSSVPAGNRTLFQRIIPTYDLPGGIGYTLTRFREAEQTMPPDILAIGSSHAFMSFDPRLFAEAGQVLFCMGSTSQTPMNTYFLLRKYLEKMRPGQVLLEVYLPVFEIEDGLESYHDLLANSPLSKEMFGMALATGNVHAVNAFFGEALARQRRPLDGYPEREKTVAIRYVPGGYVESEAVYEPAGAAAKSRIHLLDKQLAYLSKTIRLCRKEKVAVALVAHPFSREFLESRPNYAEATAQIARLAEKEGVRYLDFNGLLELDSRADFRDETHLNASGVRKFNAALLEVL